jgi:hypothetical protein
VGRRVELLDTAPVTGEERRTNVIAPPVQMLGEVVQRLWRIAEPVQEEDPPRVAGAQVQRTRAGDDRDGSPS